MNLAVHGCTDITSYVAFLAKHPPRAVTAPLGTVPSGDSERGIRESRTQNTRKIVKLYNFLINT